MTRLTEGLVLACEMLFYFALAILSANMIDVSEGARPIVYGLLAGCAGFRLSLFVAKAWTSNRPTTTGQHDAPSQGDAI